jgi:restriction endonuclease S subunit
MGLKYFKSSLEEISRNRNLRLDFRLLNYTNNRLPFPSTSFRKFIVELNNGKDIGKENYVGYNSSDVIYPTVNNFKKGELVMSSVTFIADEWLDEKTKVLVSEDVIISRSGTVGITFIWNQDAINQKFNRDVVAIPSGYLIVVKVDKSKIVPHFIKHYFSTNFMRTYFNVFGVGKSQKNIAQPEILSIPIPNISKTIQGEILKSVLPIEKEIEILVPQIRQEVDILNEVFVKTFDWKTSVFEDLKTVKVMKNPLNLFANNIDLRFSYKFHNKAGEHITKILKSQTSKRIKDYLSEDITLGKSIAPTDYDENGDYYYISMADIKNWCFETEEAKKVTQSYFTANPNKRVAINDIILARSGEGTIGKVAIITDEEVEGIYADFTMRIRLKDYNPVFAYYYFRTDFFQYLVYTHKKGLGNNTNIFPSQIKEFPIPDISIKDQESLVEEIERELKKQRLIEEEIKTKKQKISFIIEEAIKANTVASTINETAKIN